MMGDVAKGLKSFKQGMADEDDEKMRRYDEQRRNEPRASCPATRPPDRRHAAPGRSGRTAAAAARRIALSRISLDVRRRFFRAGGRRHPRADLHRPQGPPAAYCERSAIGSAACAAWRGTSRRASRLWSARPSSRRWRSAGGKRMSGSCGCIPPDAHYPEPGQADEMPPVADGTGCRSTTADDELPPTSGHCREGHRRYQAAAARAFDRAQAAAAVVVGDPGRLLLRLLRLREEHFRGAGAAAAPRRPGQADLHRHFRSLLHAGEGGAVRGADAGFPGHRDAAVAVRRARPVR